jgi:hypothetical protein
MGDLSLAELVTEIPTKTVPRIGPWTAGAAVADASNDFVSIHSLTSPYAHGRNDSMLSGNGRMTSPDSPAYGNGWPTSSCPR